jgi:hypothetical protein
LWIADLLYRFALSVFIKLIRLGGHQIQILKSKILYE